jgi:hypothetical protein
VLSCASGALALGNDVLVGSLGAVGVLRVVGFTRADGTSSNQCGDKKKCDRGLCMDVDACVDGAFSLETITFMYVGYTGNNPTGTGDPTLYAQSEASVSVLGDVNGKTPVKFYFSKFQDQMVTDPDTNLVAIKLGEEITVGKYSKDLAAGLDPVFPGTQFIRIDDSNVQIRMMATCNAARSEFLRIGDRFGPIVVTGYKTDKKKQCHVYPNFADYAPDGSLAAGADVPTSSNSNSGTSTDTVAFAVLGVGFAMVALVVIIAGVVLNRKISRSRVAWDDVDSSSDLSSRHYSGADTVISGWSRAPHHPGTPATAMDLINSHQFSDVGSSVDARSASVGTSAFGEQRNTTVGTDSPLEWDNESMFQQSQRDGPNASRAASVRPSLASTLRSTNQGSRTEMMAGKV